MITQPASNDTAGQAVYWQGQYAQHLDQRLTRTLAYARAAAPADLHTHLRSFLALLHEARRSPSLIGKSLELISALHPLPVRWGLGYLWGPELHFALEHISPGKPALFAEYHTELGDVYQSAGQFERAADHARQALATPGIPLMTAARAVRVLFVCQRANGQSQQARDLIERERARFSANVPAGQAAPELRRAWLHFQQCELELLRERGQVDKALALVETMIELDRAGSATGSPAGADPAGSDPALTADLLTHRSTLLWVRGRYQRAVSDLTLAMCLYRQAESQLNAQGLKSNLGLVYWTMGELTLAEQTLREAIAFYQRIGAEQLITYDTGNLGLVYFARGDLEPALALTREHMERAQRLSFISEYHRGRRNLGTLLYYIGDFTGAEAELNAAHDFYKDRGGREPYGLDVVWLALCRAAQGEREQALGMIREMVNWSRELSSPSLEQAALRALAYLLPPEARAAPLLRCLELADATERKLEQGAVRLALASAALSAEERREHWQAGAAVLAEIGAEAWLEGASPDHPPFIPLLM